MHVRTLLRAVGLITAAAALAGILWFTVYTVRSVEDARSAEEHRFAEDAIRRAAVTCYCIEGRFPQSYEHLRDTYGLMIDEERFAIHYTVFAQNIMPDITVVER